ncbi:MAG: SLBB domain-containing protein [Eubacterium sp.]|nr:SLBB domain-containing protein [Eubacterium sp.]
MDIRELSRVMQESGIVGAGGAGFPSYAKLNEKTETLILNCAECEPLLKLHRQLLEKYAAEITAAFYQIGQTVGAKEMIIGIKKSYTKTIDALNAVLDEYPGVRLGLLDEVYPAGDEVVLIYEVTKKVVKPGGLPIDCGVAVFNVETVYNVYRAVEKNIPVVDKLVSVVGEVEHPVTVRVPIGTSIEETVRLAGAVTHPDTVYFIGGPMMGWIGSGSQPVTKTTNAVLVLPQDHLIVQKKRRKASIDLKRAAASCCQCTMCTDLCPRNRLGHPIVPHLFMRAAAFQDMQEPGIFVNSLFCSSCGLCEMYSCMQGLSPRSLLADYKAGLRANGLKPPKVEPAMVGEEREYRKVPMARLMARLNLVQYNKKAPLLDEVAAVSKVKLLLSQHIGAPASASVHVGDTVQTGQMIAHPAQGLSVGIHASIDGVVSAVTQKYIIIENGDNKQKGSAQNE